MAEHSEKVGGIGAPDITFLLSEIEEDRWSMASVREANLIIYSSIVGIYAVPEEI